ncbi:hypothetical protein QJQ45_026710 [Haematococcus lacustris]|nr:hypothetical protein QJQ45_026710 [Haematococcus lacustris]
MVEERSLSEGRAADAADKRDGGSSRHESSKRKSSSGRVERSDRPGTGSDPFASMRQPIVPNDPQAQLRMWQLQQLEARTMVLEQQAKSAATATSKTQREVYVGGLIPGAITGEALRTLFNSALAVQFQGHLMPGMDPVINVNLHPEGKYSFVEFRIPDMATAALALSGQVQLLGCNLSVARPSGYVDPSKALNSSQATAAALAAFKRGDMQALAAAALAGANLRGLGLPPHIEDPASAAAPQVTPGVNIDGLAPLPTSVVCITGMVTAERLKSDEEYNGAALSSWPAAGVPPVLSSNSCSSSSCWLSWLTPALAASCDAAAACAPLSRLPLLLPSTIAAAVTAVVVVVVVVVVVTIAQGSHGPPATAAAVLSGAAVTAIPPSDCQGVHHSNSSGSQLLKEDLQEQCNGIVKDCCLEVKIPRPHDPALSDQYLGIANYGRVFVKFVTPEAALVCKDKIHGRLYGGSLVQVYFITDEAFTKA